MRIIHCLTIILLLAKLPASAQTPNEILAAELDAFIENQITQQSIPGASTCIVKQGQIVYRSAFGTANFSTNTPVTLQTEFTLASISKLFVATACAQLWENGVLDIDADINTYLPIAVINPNFPAEPITVRQLLQHRSSLVDSEYDLQLWDAPGDPIYTLAEFCASYFVQGGALFQMSNWNSVEPGVSDYWYSNAGFTLLGYIVEVVSEVPFNIYIKDHILTPLNMETSGWYYSEVDSNGMSMPYNTNLQPYGFYSVPEYPAAMLKSNILELANFLIAYTQLGYFEGEYLVNGNTFSSIVPNSMTNGFGWWGSDTWYGDQSGNYWSHGGFMNGVRTQLNYYPNDSTGLIILTNSEGDYSAIQNQLESYIPLFQTDTISSIYSPAICPFTIYPNPISSEDEMFIRFNEQLNHPIRIEMHKITGELCKVFELDNRNTSVTLSNLKPGIYSLVLREKNNLWHEKIVVY